MAKKFLVNLDLDQNQLLNAILQVLATNPGTPSAGQVWYRSDDRTVRFYDGTAVRRLAELVGSGAVSITYNADGTASVGVTKASVDALDVDADTVDSQHASDLLARANHTGTQAISTVSGLQTALDGKSDDGHGHVIGDVTGLQTSLDAKIDESREGAANGIATLDASSKLLVAQLPDVALGGLSYQGTWDAATNTPTLGAVPDAGVFYKVSAEGGTSLSGITDWNIGDWVISDGTAWQKIDNTDQVSSVAGKSGAVTLDTSDIDGLIAALDAKSDDGHTHAIADVATLSAALAERFVNNQASPNTLYASTLNFQNGQIVSGGGGAYIDADRTNGFAARMGFDGTGIYYRDTDGAETYAILDGDARLTDARTPTAHTHTEAEITDLDKYTQAEADALLDNKSDLGHGHVLGDITNLPAELNDRPKRYAYSMSLASSGPMVSTHSLNTTDISTAVFDVTTGEKVEIDVEIVDANNVRWDWIGSQQLRFVVHG